MKHIKLQSRPRYAADIEIEIDPCMGEMGLDLLKCRKNEVFG